MLKVARKGDKIATLLECDVQHTGLPDASFDIIIISLALIQGRFKIWQQIWHAQGVISIWIVTA